MKINPSYKLKVSLISSSQHSYVQLANGTTSTIFAGKSMVKFTFKNKHLFCLSHKKAMCKHVHVIDTRTFDWMKAA
jgi:hypothetical protein